MEDKINASEFKAKCLGILDTINIKKKRLVIYKHGKPIAFLTPYTNDDQTTYPQEKLFGSVEVLADITGPTLNDLEIKLDSNNL